jgi:integrase/recombinase XerD
LCVPKTPKAMKEEKVTIAVIHETRRTLSDGTHPVKLRVTYKGQRKYYTVNFDPERKGLTVKEWEKVESKNPRKAYREYSETLKAFEHDARETVKDIPEFSFEAFEKKFFNNEASNDLLASMLSIAGDFRKRGGLKTADTYLYAVKSLKKFANSERLPFSKVTPEFLRRYEHWMLTQGKEIRKKGKDGTVKIVRIPNSKTTISMYLRAVRATFNKAEIKDGYPFGKRKYEMPTAQKVKKALTLEEIGMIYKYDALPGSTRDRIRDYFILSYLCNGMNMKDLALLKYKDIDSEAIRFVRAKTAGKVSRAVVVPLTIEIGKLLDKHGQRPALPDTYVLPILAPGMNAQQQRTAIDNIVRLMNKELKKIAANIGISVKVGTYTARHSFATVLKRSGVSMELISESLGHTNLKTTEGYLADFEIAKKREAADLLTKWA